MVVEASTLSMIGNAPGEKSREMRIGASVIDRFNSSIASWHSAVQLNRAPFRKSTKMGAAVISSEARYEDSIVNNQTNKPPSFLDRSRSRPIHNFLSLLLLWMSSVEVTNHAHNRDPGHCDSCLPSRYRHPRGPNIAHELPKDLSVFLDKSPNPR